MFAWIREHWIEILLVELLLCGLTLIIWGIILREEPQPTETRVEVRVEDTWGPEIEMLQIEINDLRYQHDIDMIALCLVIRDLREEIR